MSSESRAYSPALSDLGSILARLLPDAGKIEPMKVAGEGFRSIAIETASGALIRIGKTAEAASGFELETRALPFIRRYITTHIPDPRWYAPPCDDLPFGALGYMKLPGANPKPGDSMLGKMFIPELAKFLVQLHSLPTDEAIEAGVPTVDPHQQLLGARDVVMPVMLNHLSQSEFARLERWWDEIATDRNLARYDRAVCHHDLWYENLLVDSKLHLSGVLDWSHIEVGDPMRDFAAIHHFGEELTAQFIDEYRDAGGIMGDAELHRIRRYWEGRDMGGLAWAIENDDEVETEDAIRKVRNGPIFK